MDVIPNVVSASVTRDCTDSCPLLESSKLKVVSDAGRFDSGWYRVEGLFAQGALMERYPIMTMLCESNAGDRNRGTVEMSVDGRSVLYPAKERHLLAGSYIPKGADGAARAASYLRECTPAPVVAEGSFRLDDPLVLDADISYIAAVWTILDAAGWCMQIHGDGTIHILEKPTVPDLSLDSARASILRPAVSISRDIADIPNYYVAIDGDLKGEALNDNPDSILSTVSRGRVIDMVDRSPIRINGESLESYARRKLEEESTIIKTYDYDRAWWPDIHPFSVVRGSIPDADMSDDMRVLSQSFECGNGITVSETSGIVEKEFVA
jgi:hypothetical protein